jgi:hypothetical protein
VVSFLGVRDGGRPAKAKSEKRKAESGKNAEAGTFLHGERLNSGTAIWAGRFRTVWGKRGETEKNIPFLRG